MTTGVARAEPGRLRAVAAKSAFGRHRFEAVVVGHFLTTVLALSCLGFLFFLSFFCELLPLPIWSLIPFDVVPKNSEAHDCVA